MKHSHFFQKVRLAFLTSMVFLTSGSAFAQGDGKAFLDAMDREVGTLGVSIISLLTKALGIGALISFVIVIVKIFNEDREAAKKLAWWVIGFTLGFVGLKVVAAQTGLG